MLKVARGMKCPEEIRGYFGQRASKNIKWLENMNWPGYEVA